MQDGEEPSGPVRPAPAERRAATPPDSVSAKQTRAIFILPAPAGLSVRGIESAATSEFPIKDCSERMLSGTKSVYVYVMPESTHFGVLTAGLLGPGSCGTYPGLPCRLCMPGGSLHFALPTTRDRSHGWVEA